MKQIFFAAVLVLAGFTSIAADKNINEKLVQAFNETYPNAVEVSWLAYPESYIVYFEEKGVKANIIFSQDGTFIRATRYYTKEYLPFYLVTAIREKFPERTIYSVTEVSTPDNIDYYVKLEDAKTWMTVKVDSEGNIRRLEKLNKD
jgi:hypothetical protein